jgi:PAS domain S-box-containing protein
MVEQQAAVAEIGQRALADEPLETLLTEACELVRSILDVNLVDVLELSKDRSELRIIAGVGWRPGVVGVATLPANTGSMSGYTLVTGGPVIVEDFPAETRFTVQPIMFEHQVVAAIAVRVGELQNPFGVLAAFTTQPAEFTREDANFLQAVANVLAAAVERRSIESQLRSSRDQLSAIFGTIDEGITVQGMDGQLVFANDAAARLSGFASAEEMLEAPLAEIMTRFELFDDGFAPLGPADLPSRRALAGEEPPSTLIGFRVRATGEVRWSMLTSTPLRDADGSVRQVINTFRDVTEERWTRDSRHLMTEAVEALSSTLDAYEAARRLAELAVPRMSDYCTVHLLEADGSVTSAAIAHTDPSRVAIARRLQQLRPLDPAAPTGIARVIRENAPEFVPLIPDEMIESTLQGEELDLVRQLGLRSYVCVPLTGRGAPVGALTLVMAESGRVLGERDLALAVELGMRAGIALENARLYQAADDRRAQLDTVLAALAEAVLVFDASGQLRLSNKAADELFGGSSPGTMDELLHQRLRLTHTEGDEVPTPEGDVHEVHLDLNGRWLEMRRYRALRGMSGETNLLAPTVVVLRDITSARAASAARDAFMGVLSHELRTPVTTIYGGSQLLGRNLDDEHRADVVSDIQVESERLARLVEDLLVMTRVERGMVEISDEPVLLQHLLGPVAQSTAERVGNPEIRLDIGDRLPAVRGDATYVEQVVRNLLTNAVRYGRGLQSGVDVQATEEDDRVVVRVLDRGPGFQDDDPERLFDLFYRATSARSVPGGAGIGLFVCRHLIEAMGGQIWARSREGGGAEFGFYLPVMEADFSA